MNFYYQIIVHKYKQSNAHWKHIVEQPWKQLLGSFKWWRNKAPSYFCVIIPIVLTLIATLLLLYCLCIPYVADWFWKQILLSKMNVPLIYSERKAAYMRILLSNETNLNFHPQFFTHPTNCSLTYVKVFKGFIHIFHLSGQVHTMAPQKQCWYKSRGLWNCWMR